VLQPSLVVDKDAFHAPTVTPRPTVAEVLAAQKEGKMRDVDLARLLATIKAYHEHGYVPADFRAADCVPIPAEIVTILAERLVGGEAWSREINNARTDTTAAMHAAWQAAAHKIRDQDPKLRAPGKKHEVARRVAKQREPGADKDRLRKLANRIRLVIDR
jgi:hypothetical protein